MSKGSEQTREDRISSLKDAGWNLDTLLELHYWFLHRSQKAQYGALDALLDIVDRNPEATSVSPFDLLKDVICPMTFDSGAAPIIFHSLTERDTPAADEALKEILRGSGKARNEDFGKFVEIAVASGKSDLLNVLDSLNLSQSKSEILRQALKE